MRRSTRGLCVGILVAAVTLAAACGGGGGGGGGTTTPTHTLAVTLAGGGTGTVGSAPAGIDCGSKCSATFASGSAVTLTATPSAGAIFDGWSGACTGSGACVLDLAADRAVTATFTATHALTVASAGLGTGTIGSSPAGIDCGATCTFSYAGGASVTLTATPAAGVAFAGWSGACTGTGPCTVAMGADKAVTARFVLATCAAPGGRLTSGEFISTNDTYVNTQAHDGGGTATPVPDGQFEQCARLDTGTTAGLKASWTWSWPHQTAPAEQITRATPSIVWGFKPWDPQSTTASLPRRVTEVGSLRITATVAQEVGADLVADVGVVAYLTTSPTKGALSSLPIGKRLFIYRNLYEASGGGGGAVAGPPVTIDGISWDLLVRSDAVFYTPHASPAVPATALDLDVAHFLADALRRGAIDPKWWLSSVETAAIIWEGSGSLTLDDYQVQYQEAKPVATDRPARSAERVLYAAGTDGVFGTGDDVAQSANSVLYDEGGGVQRDAWFSRPDLSTPQGYWLQPPGGTHGFTVTGWGTDTAWFTGDDTIYSWEEFGPVTDHASIHTVYTGTGTVADALTPHDQISAYYALTHDASGAELRRVYYTGPGNGTWFDGDDTIGSYDVNTFAVESARWGAWVRQVNYDGPGDDGVWLTADDEIATCRIHTFLDGTDYWTTESVYLPGPDRKCFTSDDQMFAVVRATNTYR